MLLAVLSSCLLLAAATWLWNKLQGSSNTAVPVVPGLPLLGSVVALGRGGTAFLSQCRQQFGDVFCVHVLHQRMVFIFDPAMLSLFFKAPESQVSFKPAVKRFTQRVYGLPSSEFFERHEPLLATLRQLLVPDQLDVLGRRLLGYATPQLHGWQQQGKVELWASCQRLVFQSAGRVLFGEAFFDRHGLEAVQRQFLAFEENFEIAASPVPHLLLPAFRQARSRLLRMFRESLAAGDFEGTIVNQLLQGCGMCARYQPNLLLAVLWASQANSMPALHWSLAFLLLPEQAAARQKVLTELSDAAAQQQQQQQQRVGAEPQAGQQQQQQQLLIPGVDTTTAAAMMKLAVDKGSFVSRCVAEAVRLRLHSIAIRYVAVQDLVLPRSQSSSSTSVVQHPAATVSTNSSNVTNQISKRSQQQQQQQQQQQVVHVPRGSVLCICPTESHHDSRLFPGDPWGFDPDRPGVQGLQPGTVVPSLAGMGYGGGFWRCPGRFFAEMELALLVQLVLLQLHLTPIPAAALAADSVHPTSAAPTSDGSTTKPAGTSWQRLLPQCLRDVLVFGLGALGGSQQQAAQWRASGDPQRLLPAANLLRLVGFKVPQEPWWLAVTRRQL